MGRAKPWLLGTESCEVILYIVVALQETFSRTIQFLRLTVRSWFIIFAVAQPIIHLALILITRPYLGIPIFTI